MPRIRKLVRQPKAEDQRRGDGRQRGLARGGAELDHAGHDAAAALEPAGDGGQRDHVVGRHAEAEEGGEDQVELPGRLDEGEQCEAEAVAETRDGEHDAGPERVVQPPAEDREGAHDEDGQRGAARQRACGTSRIRARAR
jgi:hypothetical protein